MARHFLALLALRLAVACQNEECEGEEAASLMQLQPRQHAELAILESLENRRLAEFLCLAITPPTFIAVLDGARISEDSLPVNVGPGSELTIFACNLAVGALGAGPLVSGLGEGAKLAVYANGCFNTKVVGGDFVPFGALPEDTVAFVEEESARFEAVLADAQRRWAVRGDGCPAPPGDGPPPVPPPVQVASSKGGKKGDSSKGAKKGDGSLLERKAKEEAKKVAVASTIFPPVLVGPVGKGARVEIGIKESANVEVRRGSVTVIRGSLVGNMVRAEGVLEDVVVRVLLQESAKVQTDQGFTLWNGNLVADVVTADGYNDADVQVTLKEVANVYAANMTFVMGNSPLTATVLAGGDAGLERSEARLGLYDTANINAYHLRFVGEEDLDSVVMREVVSFPFPAKGLRSRLSAGLEETGNVRVKGSILGRGHLFDAVMDLGDFKQCTVEATMEESGNAYAASRVSEGEPPWIGNVVSLDEADDTSARVKVEQSSNQKINLLEVAPSPTSGGFIGEVLRLVRGELEKVRLYVRVDDSVNWYGEVLDMPQNDGQLLENAIDVEGDLFSSSVDLFVSKVANAFGGPRSAVCLRESLIDDAATLQRVTESSVSVRLLDSANVLASYFWMAIEDVVDAALDTNELVWDSKLDVKVERSCNVKAATVNISDGGELLEQALQTQNLQGDQTSASVYVSKSANVAAYALYMGDRSFLIDHGASVRFRDNAAKGISVDLSLFGSGSAVARQATLRERSRLINDVLEIGDATTDLPDTSIYVKASGNLAVQQAGRVAGGSVLIGNFVEEPGDASTLEKLQVIASGVAKGPVTFNGNSQNCLDDFVVDPSSCRGPY